MSRTETSVQLYTVRTAIAADLGGTLTRLAAIGFRHVEPFGLTSDPARTARALAEAGLTAPSAHTRLLGDDLAAALEAARTVGVTTLVQPKVEAARWADRDGVEGVARELNEAAANAADQGVTIGYHNHAWELEATIDGTPALEVLADLLDDRVVLELDTYWAQVGGVDPVGLLGRLGERVTHLHLKDGPVSREATEQVALGRGAMDVPAILAAAPHAVRVLELDDCAGDVIDALREGLAHLAEVDR